MQQDFPSDMQQGYLLDLTCDMGINKRQRYAILAFVKIDRRHGEPVKGPRCHSLFLQHWLTMIDQRQVTNQVYGVVPMYGLYQAKRGEAGTDSTFRQSEKSPYRAGRTLN